MHGWYALADRTLEENTGNSHPDDRICNRREFTNGDEVQAHRRRGDIWELAVVRGQTAAGYLVHIAGQLTFLSLREDLVRRVPRRRIVHTTLLARRQEGGIVEDRLPLSFLAAFE